MNDVQATVSVLAVLLLAALLVFDVVGDWLG